VDAKSEQTGLFGKALKTPENNIASGSPCFVSLLRWACSFGHSCLRRSSSTERKHHALRPSRLLVLVDRACSVFGWTDEHDPVDLKLAGWTKIA
jgi:hypothetical protein